MEVALIGQMTILRSVTVDDAGFIADLRSNSRVNKYLSSSKPIDLEEQVAWLNQYMMERDGFYFIIERKMDSKKIGTISIYNFDEANKRAEFGRYISTDPLGAIESEHILLQFAFNVLKLNMLYCRTAELNNKVWKQHISFGFNDIGFELLEDKNLLLRLQEITRCTFDKFDYSVIVNIIKRFNRQ